MSFFSKVASYVFNKLLVEGLANNKTFQRFALKIDEAYKHGATNVAEPASKQASVIAEQAAAFTKDFRANFEKELEKILSETQKKPPPKK